MSARTRVARILIAVAAGSALALTAAAPAAMSAPSPTVAPSSKATSLIKGTWVGTYAGFEDGKRMHGFEKFIITKSNGNTVLGTWQYRASKADPWSAPAPVQWVVCPSADGLVQVTGADANGIYFGHMTADGKTLDLSYQGSVHQLVALHFVMVKK